MFLYIYLVKAKKDLIHETCMRVPYVSSFVVKSSTRRSPRAKGLCRVTGDWSGCTYF